MLFETLVDSHALPSGVEMAKKREKNPACSRIASEIPRSDFPEHYSTKQREKPCKRPNRMHDSYTASAFAVHRDLLEQKKPDMRQILELYKAQVTSTIASSAPCSPTRYSDSSVWPLQRGWGPF